MNKKITIWVGIIWLIGLFLIYYFTLPFINLQSVGFYVFLLIFLSYPVTLITLIIRINNGKKNKNNKPYKKLEYERLTGKFVWVTKSSKARYKPGNIITSCLVILSTIIIGFTCLMGLIGSVIFNAKAYAKQLNIHNGSEIEFKETFDYNEGEVLLPIIDKDLAFKLAQAKLGDYGAQYSLDYDNFTILSVERNGQTELLRVAPLEYSNFFVSISRMNKGTIGYIEVNLLTKETKLVTFEDGLKYMPSAKLAKDLDRHIRFNYPSELYQSKFFEIDNDGNPYWVIPTYKKEICLLSGSTAKGVILVDPITGNTNYYHIGEEPTWVQRVIDDRIVEKQANNALYYKNGWFNAEFGQKKEVFQLSDGYNYFIKNGETYYVSCITSPNEADQTSIGFLAINLKTRVATRYNSLGITEMRAREIAENDERVKAQALTSTWPILINYHNIPTYFLVLKNEVQDQRIVLMNASDGTIVSMEENLKATQIAYEQLLSNKGVSVTEDKETLGTVTKIRDLGTTIEFMIDSVPDKYFVVNVDLNVDARFLSIGDQIDITYQEYQTYNFVKKLKTK